MPIYPKSRYKRFKETLPDNLKNTPESEYRMRKYWKHNGRPESFEESNNQDVPMFDQDQDGLYHAPSIEPNTLKFLKPKNHPTVNKELEWFNGDSDEAKSFRRTHALKQRGKFYKYKKK